jgi:hypothetical protein
MIRLILCSFALLWTARLTAAELQIDLDKSVLNQPPAGFRSLVTGQGEPGRWQVVLDEVPSQIKTFTAAANATSKRPVIAQLSQDKTDEHFPILVYDKEVFDDFSLKVSFKTVAGSVEQMAGIAFRLQDEKNYYVIRASALGNTFRFYKVVAGIRTAPIGPSIEITRNAWHELSIECKGNQIRSQLDGKEVLPALTDNSFASGKIGLWTKSDSVSHFTDLRIRYTPRERVAQKIVRDVLKDHKKVEDIQIFARPDGAAGSQVIGSKNEALLGQAGGPAVQEVIDSEAAHFGRGIKNVIVILPLKDRNGEPVAAVKLVMDSFIGETEQTAVARATDIVKWIQLHFKTRQELLE